MRVRTTSPSFASRVLALGLAGCGGDASGPPVEGEAAAEAKADDGSPEEREPPPPGAFELPGLREQAPAAERLGWPTESLHVTSTYGWRVDPVTGQGTRLHRGIDLRGTPGDLILSIGDGTVEFAGHDPLLGNLVIVDHGQGLQSFYGHLSDVLVAARMDVERGAALGLAGNTGRSAAPHLHLSVRLDGVPIDPLEVIGEPQHRPTAAATRLGDLEQNPAPAPAPAPAESLPPAGDPPPAGSPGQ
jgi:murein DD-endopeptidase MepM/ murein hydrolase activator NlpD